MRSREVSRRLRELGRQLVRQVGSHERWDSRSGHCHCTVPVHAGRAIPRGTLGNIERSMEHCLGRGWLLGR
ncbi:MAG: type II toxin-antitoxin system HicA family toxin [Deltaproteobacteria bacterium]|nr:type II toxin-antitoxin system HicA family toxin [Deltaproteobacteria bacterium]